MVNLGFCECRSLPVSKYGIDWYWFSKFFLQCLQVCFFVLFCLSKSCTFFSKFLNSWVWVFVCLCVAFLNFGYRNPVGLCLLILQQVSLLSSLVSSCIWHFFQMSINCDWFVCLLFLWVLFVGWFWYYFFVCFGFFFC